MSAYIIFRLDITDPEKIAGYARAMPPLLAKHQAELLVADPNGETLEGNSQNLSVVLRFPSKSLARAFYDDPDYGPLKQVRHEASANTTVVLAEAYVPSH